jgi:hypothetical protein
LDNEFILGPGQQLVLYNNNNLAWKRLFGNGSSDLLIPSKMKRKEKKTNKTKQLLNLVGAPKSR